MIGFDDIEAALYTTPLLTTIHQPRLKIGQLAMQTALALLDSQIVQDQRLAYKLVVRQSMTGIR